MSRLKPALPLALAILTGVLLILTYPNANIGFLAAIGLTPLLLAVSREPRPWRRFLLGWAAGFVYWFGICNWIQFVLELHGGMGRWGGWGSFLVFCALKSIHMGLFAMFAAIVLPHPYAIPAIAALWTGIERTHANAGFAWLALGNAGIDMQLPLRLAPFTGVYGLSFLFACMSVAVALVVLRRPRRQLLWLALLLVVFALPSIPAQETPAETAVVVQPNLDEEQEWSPATAALMHERLIDESLRAALQYNPRLIVWPEAPGPFYYSRDVTFREEADGLARQAHAWFLFGGVEYTAKDQPLNSAVMISPQGQFVDRYDKILLVPFGEYVPPIFEWVNRITKEAGDFVPGSRRVLFNVAGHRIATFICYESAFPNDVRKFAADGAEMLVNISNDGYFGKSAARAQHLQIVRMRAVENRRWIVRATNDGFTAAVDPGGRVLQELPPYTERTAPMGYSYVNGTTFYTRTGDWFAWSCLALGILSLFASQWPHYTPPKKPASLTTEAKLPPAKPSPRK